MLNLLPPAVVILCSTATAAGQKDDLGLMIPDVGATGAIDPSEVAPINELLLARFQETWPFQVFGSADLVDLLEAEERKMLVGCADDNCFVQIGGALGVNLVAKASVGKLGDTYLFNLKVLNVATAEAEARCVREVTGKADDVLPAVKQCVSAVTYELNHRLQLGLELVEEGKIGPLALYLAGGTAVAAGIATLALDAAVGSEADALRDNPEDADARNRGKNLQTLEQVTLGVTVAVAVAAGVIAFFTDFGGERPEVAVSLAPAVTPHGAGLVIAGEF